MSENYKSTHKNKKLNQQDNNGSICKCATYVNYKQGVHTIGP